MADSVATAPATYRQPSRKGKKTWRKNVDLTEIQDGLEDVRDEIIKGGIVAEKGADDLFTTDTKGNEEIAQKLNGRKLLKADEILAQRSAVPGLEGRKRKVEDTVVPGSIKRTKNGKFVSHRELQRLKDVAGNSGEVKVVEDEADYDPWAVSAAPLQKPRLSFLEPKRKPQAPETLQHAPTPLTVSGKAVPHIPKPDAGKSYNPLVTDWSALIEREGGAAVAAEQARLEAETIAAERDLTAANEAAKVEAREREDYATDYESAWESEWEGIQSDLEGQQVYTQKQQRRKTPAERNKVKARKEREAREKWERKQKAREEQEKKIKQIAKEPSAKYGLKPSRTTTIPTPSDSGSENGDQVQLQKRRFGQKPLPDAPLEIVLPDELQDSLRRLKPEGDLLTDRYRNMLINGKIEVRKRVGQTKARKTFRTEKWSYKDWKLK